MRLLYVTESAALGGRTGSAYVASWASVTALRSLMRDAATGLHLNRKTIPQA